MESHPLSPIGIIRSPFREKFGIPRQPGLADIPSTLEMLPAYSQPEAFRELSTFSHIWLLFLFHANQQSGWHPTVRPPRIGGNRRVGVFASRSPFRPNGIGMSVVRLAEIQAEGAAVRLMLNGADLMDGTPVVDIKPYIAWADAIPDAKCGFADQRPGPEMAVAFTPNARKEAENAAIPDLTDQIVQILSLDPRPGYLGRDDPDRIYGIRLFDRDVRWRVSDGTVEVLAVEKRNEPPA